MKLHPQGRNTSTIREGIKGTLSHQEPVDEHDVVCFCYYAPVSRAQALSGATPHNKSISEQRAAVKSGTDHCACLTNSTDSSATHDTPCTPTIFFSSNQSTAHLKFPALPGKVTFVFTCYSSLVQKWHCMGPAAYCFLSRHVRLGFLKALRHCRSKSTIAGLIMLLLLLRLIHILYSCFCE